MGTRSGPDLEVVIPAHDAALTLGRVLDALLPAAVGRILVVDAGSSDATAELARSRGARVLRLETRQGPAAARNAGVEATTAEVVLFLDADCVAHPDVVERVRAAFGEDPELAGLSGSYDDAPAARGFYSQYMNLRHHLTHQLARRDHATFWAGCGAVRRAPFLAAGGFDAARYPRPQIEDIELGLRLRRLGARLRLDPALQVTHLKEWSMRSVLRTDLYDRALPWSALILEHGELPTDLNLRASQRWAAVLAAPALAAPALAVLAAVETSWPLGALTLAILGASLAANRDLVTFFASRRGWGFALRAWLFHQVHLVLSAAAFLASWLRRPRSPRDLLLRTRSRSP
ncbi:MAG TPA: glycosyltransferase family A protein [Thermoanaerobaculia bacterium]|nr:glycosyltransferase family A protein [Thermoanaerobaculia bacterium]